MTKTTSQLGSLSVLVAWLAASAGVRSAAQLFPSSVFPTSAIASSVSGDLNGDGHEDLVVSKTADNALRVFLSDGAGGVLQLADVPAPPHGLLAVGDLTGDGLPDVVASKSGAFQQPPHLLHVFPGDGTGALGPPITTVQPHWISGAAVLDVNEDGLADLLGLGWPPSPTLMVLLGDGAGGLLPAIESPIAYGWRFQAGDLDEDGHVDVVVTAAGSCCTLLEVMLGDGAGGFVSAGQYSQGVSYAWSTVLGDLNGDGHLDVVSTGENPVTHALELVVVLLGDGAGGFGPPAAVTVPSISSELDSSRLYDVERDGDLDLILRLNLQDSITVMLNDGQGDLAPPQFLLPAGRLVLGSLDADALPDALIVFDEAASGGLALYPGLPQGGFDTVPRFEVPQNTPGDLDLGDLDGDGALDVVRGDRSASSAGIIVQLADGQGGLLPGNLVTMPGRPWHTAVGDLDEDGALDVVTSNVGSDDLSVLLGDGRGGFGPPISTELVSNLKELGVADFDGDGHLDVLAAGLASVVLFKGDGSGRLTKVSVSHGPPTGGLVELDLADIDHDGDPDAVGDTDAGPTVWRGDGGTGFQSVTTYPYVGAPVDVVFADVDLDGHQDIVAANQNGTIAVLLADGQGDFGSPLVQSGGSGTQTRELEVADVSGDGLPDTVLSRGSQDRVVVLLGDGRGGFALESAGYAVGHDPGPIAVVDVDADGRRDVLAAAGSTYTSLLRNLVAPFTWKDLGHALAGALEAPTLHGSGTLAAGLPVALKLVNGRPSSAAFVVIGATQLAAPFKGGVLVPWPSLVLPVATNAEGGLLLLGSMPAGLPSGFTSYFQCWIVDPAGSAGFAASNAISGMTP